MNRSQQACTSSLCAVRAAARSDKGPGSEARAVHSSCRTVSQAFWGKDAGLTHLVPGLRRPSLSRKRLPDKRGPDGDVIAESSVSDLPFPLESSVGSSDEPIDRL